eukprot:g407.t1
MATISYQSTRGGVSGKSFEDVVLEGLAPDGGLYVPSSFPQVSSLELRKWRNFSFPELSAAVIRKFVTEAEIPTSDLNNIVKNSYAAARGWRDSSITPVKELNGLYILELFHGPTFAFKDVALQLLGHLFEYFISRKGGDNKITILGATSGDTGGAAIAGLQGKSGVETFILFPEGRVSTIQERQMTSVAASNTNIHCLSVRGTFDDAQAIVKRCFRDKEFNDEMKLGAVNSINWARVLAQIVYYFSAYFQVTESADEETKPHFVVPTGNFGDILAGFYAKQMGLPVGKLVVGTNENDILHRFFETGEYFRDDEVAKTLSPSMDICVSSNFERFLYWLHGNNAARVRSMMQTFGQEFKLSVPRSGVLHRKAREEMLSARADADETLELMKDYFVESGYVFCPHSAVGAIAVRKLHTKLGLKRVGKIGYESLTKNKKSKVVVLATASPGKFPAAVSEAIGAENMPNVPLLTRLLDLRTEKTILDATKPAVMSMMRKVKGGKQVGNQINWKTALLGAALVTVCSYGLLKFSSRRRK